MLDGYAMNLTACSLQFLDLNVISELLGLLIDSKKQGFVQRHRTAHQNGGFLARREWRMRAYFAKCCVLTNGRFSSRNQKANLKTALQI